LSAEKWGLVAALTPLGVDALIGSWNDAYSQANARGVVGGEHGPFFAVARPAIQ
jgi:hypothetical protein